MKRWFSGRQGHEHPRTNSIAQPGNVKALPGEGSREKCSVARVANLGRGSKEERWPRSRTPNCEGELPFLGVWLHRRQQEITGMVPHGRAVQGSVRSEMSVFEKITQRKHGRGTGIERRLVRELGLESRREIQSPASGYC